MDTLRGSLLMVLAMAAFALEDMFIKSAARSLPVGQILILFGAGGMVIFAIVARAQGHRLWNPVFCTRALLVRSVAEVAGRLCFTLAIALTPLSSASAILQATPLVVSAGAVVFFGEHVGLRRWLAIAAGFIGVLMILRPGASGFELASLFAVAGTLGFAGRDLATRAAPAGLSNAHLGLAGFAMLVVAGLIALPFGAPMKTPDAATTIDLAAATLVGVVAYQALTGAMRVGEISVVAPFRYTRLIFAMVLGVVVFQERPDMWTLIGSAVIVISGGFTLMRSNRRQVT
ncbi:DMT family transporter [Phaeobacter inhibens]|uniref:DMT family transporter n=1 Tax=Phaeobacter inhibens TaxID=221822 RepID=UPI000160E7CC|nr:DMT family transporter [Phaeobacter inhibens]AFO88714.1 putative integral membrane protein [Phaeobacter inhibens 2.10]AXT43446.1 DMT family transporter [Phaeobacter inhibens]UWR79672.1 DMT family transporter [Phaeobacter inhibens]